MEQMLKLFRRLGRDTAGLSTVEYVILLALVAILSIGAWRTFGGNLEEKVDDAAAEIQGL